ncbi:ABC-three component system protein [Ureaplasma parvum]|uniref:ABC-three component system protein n=1 Tax=Ureaplasma parvum TaxID=134821 RepID=UPI00016C00D4|nr:ABC-three component system protein [Ureaplasma parvum]MBS5832909.1 SMEK domain-containing protein [Ureaplasma parvum]MDU4141951.1 ABC-three component system protein [Ureaplasma parvum]UIU28653.1 SMEK domain-containing protein [Ureaplasma parvum]
MIVINAKTRMGGKCLKRENYFNYISEKISVLSTRIKLKSKLNLLDLNIHSENFFAQLCNIIFDLKFVNANTLQHNIEGIDLIDKENKVIAQVSSTCNKKKIEDSLNKNIYKDYRDYKYKFISIAIDAPKNMNNQIYNNPYSLEFEPKNDIWDSTKLLRKIKDMDLAKLRKLYEFVRNELGEDINLKKIDTNLAKIVKTLSEKNLSDVVDSPEINEFAIKEKMEFNNLIDVRNIIDDNKIYYTKLDTIYSEFDKQGQNKSFSVFKQIRRFYFEYKNKGLSSSEIFHKIIEKLISFVSESNNYQELSFEELSCCIDIIVVDAFIRCKIFENPKGYNYAITR